MPELRIEWTAVGAGVLSFLVAYSFDWAALKRVPGLKQSIAIVVVVLHGYALLAASWGGTRFWLPDVLFWISLGLLPLSLFLLAYSFFLEIPFAKTYAQAGTSGQLVTTGTYGLVRHPGVIWYALFLLALLFVTRSVTLLVATPLWVLLNILYVVLQERFFFDKMFPGYPEYRRQTPMLIPTGKSIARCLQTLGPRRSP